jgi:hypothetical protein
MTEQTQRLSGYRDNALEPNSSNPKRLGLLSRVALRIASIETGPLKRLGQLFLVALPFAWPAVLAPFFGWKWLTFSGMMLVIWIVPGFVVLMTAPNKIPVIQIVLRFSWWPVYGLARLYRWVRDGK